MTTKELLAALEHVEYALGNNLTWLDDALDLRIRQGDKDTVRRLAELNAAWVRVCRAIAAAKAAWVRVCERYAEDAREDDAKFQSEQQIEDALASTRTARKEHSALVLDKREWRYDTGTMPAAYAAVGEKMAELRQTVAEAHKRITLLRDNPWRAVGEGEIK